MLWAKVLKAKYFPHTTLFTCNRNAQGSHIWKSFLLGLQDLREGMSWIVGNGNTIRIWTDPWLPHGSPHSYIEGPIIRHEEDRTVSSLRLSHSWNFEALHFPLSTHLKNIIQGTPVAHFTSLEDTFLWTQNNGICSVKSASKFLYHKQQVPFHTQQWNWIWSLHCPKKIQMFIWKAMRDRLPTRTFLTIG